MPERLEALREYWNSPEAASSPYIGVRYQHYTWSIPPRPLLVPTPTGAGTRRPCPWLAAAQVHATLALAAAQALSGTSRMSADDSEEWESVASAL